MFTYKYRIQMYYPTLIDPGQCHYIVKAFLLNVLNKTGQRRVLSHL